MQFRVLFPILPFLTGLLCASSMLFGQRRGGFDPSEFLSRLDANGNGQIDPEESEGRAGFFLRRIAENNPDIDLSKPVPLERIQSAFAAARERREQGGNESDNRERFGGWSRDGDRERDRDNDRDRGQDRDRNSSSSSSAEKEQLVPGFGEQSELPPVPGFGLLSAATGVVKITDEDRRDAERRFRYYDRNNDGVLDTEEMQRSRIEDIADYDRNRDGKLTVEELAIRYARRRVTQERVREQSATSSSGSSSTSRSSSSSSSGSSGGSSSSYGRRDDGERSRGGWFGRREGEREERDGDSRSRSTSSRSNSNSTVVYRVASAEERLSKLGVPGWFRDGDKNGDGQIAMAEFGSDWSDGALSDFASYDHNGDGLITPEECIKATKSGVSRSGSSSSASSRYGSSSRSSGSSSSRGSSRYSSSRGRAASESSRDRRDEKSEDESTERGEADSEDAEPNEETVADADGSAEEPEKVSDTSSDKTADSTSKTASEAAAKPSPGPPAEIDPRYLQYAEGRIQQLDKSGDGILSPEEWAESAKPIDAADTNGDKLITARELAIFYMQ